ncbi:MAG: hypothetical protein LKJ47_02505 [Bifidobacteriaceae bacterium]|nr:hypothetical protein [Bifidobacteriaceae bacterium]
MKKLQNEDFLRKIRRATIASLLAVGLSVTTAACGSSSSSTANTTTNPPATQQQDAGKKKEAAKDTKKEETGKSVEIDDVETDEDGAWDFLFSDLYDVSADDSARYEYLRKGMDLAVLEQLQIDSDEFMAAWLDGYEFDIQSINETDDSARAKVRLIIKPFSDILEERLSQFEYLYEDEQPEEYDVDELIADLGESILQDLKDADPEIKTVTYELVADEDLDDDLNAVDDEGSVWDYNMSEEEYVGNLAGDL